MHESSDNTRVLENGFDSMRIRFEIQPDIQESLDEDDNTKITTSCLSKFYKKLKKERGVRFLGAGVVGFV
ncbi:hypothetical protein Tco_0617189 [Tanacetum coccineum]